MTLGIIFDFISFQSFLITFFILWDVIACHSTVHTVPALNCDPLQWLCFLMIIWVHVIGKRTFPYDRSLFRGSGFFIHTCHYFSVSLRPSILLLQYIYFINLLWLCAPASINHRCLAHKKAPPVFRASWNCISALSGHHRRRSTLGLFVIYILDFSFVRALETWCKRPYILCFIPCFPHRWGTQ